MTSLNRSFKKLKKKLKEKDILTAFLIVSFVLLVSLTVWLNIDISNKIKEGRQIEAVNTITVTATGEIYAKPDLALATVSVITEAKTVTEVMTENTEKMNAVIDFVKGQGVEDKDLKTISFNIYPRYEWYEKGTCIPPCPSGKRVLIGYEIRQSLQVKIRNMEKIGDIIEGATAAGANQIDNLQLIIDKQDELKKQAREQAIEKAKAKANELASQLGVRLFKITNFTESAIFPYYGLEKAMGLGGDEGVPQIEIGENKIEATVNITYEIN